MCILAYIVAPSIWITRYFVDTYGFKLLWIISKKYINILKLNSQKHFSRKLSLWNPNICLFYDLEKIYLKNVYISRLPEKKSIVVYLLRLHLYICKEPRINGRMLPRSLTGWRTGCGLWSAARHACTPRTLVVLRHHSAHLLELRLSVICIHCYQFPLLAHVWF